MTFFLTGVESNNKGAELMLYAILQEIERKYPNAKVYIESNHISQGRNYIETSLDFKLVPNVIDYYRDKLFRTFKIYEILRYLHLVPFRFWAKVPTFDYMIDASGLHFSDQMTSPRHFKYWNAMFKKAKAYGAKIIFLPQGFGPINNATTKRSVELLSNYASLVFAREQISYDYLSNCGVFNMEKVQMYPDFTSLVDGVVSDQYKHLSGSVCIIPNMQMVDKGVLTYENYISYLVSIANDIKRQGQKIFFLNHQGKIDYKILTECKKLLPDVECVSGLNALETKGLISTAYLVISSRFHGVASSLNSCVPCIATSWSHKYKCLFDDYKQKDCVLTLTDIAYDTNLIREFITIDKNSKIREALKKIVPTLKNKSQEMWNEVWKV